MSLNWNGRLRLLLYHLFSYLVNLNGCFVVALSEQGRSQDLGVVCSCPLSGFLVVLELALFLLILHLFIFNSLLVVLRESKLLLLTHGMTMHGSVSGSSLVIS